MIPTALLCRRPSKTEIDEGAIGRGEFAAEGCVYIAVVVAEEPLDHSTGKDLCNTEDTRIASHCGGPHCGGVTYTSVSVGTD